MPFRFRKIIPFGKNFRLNLSKGGISSTFGMKGLHLNIGKRGIRPTISAPGTGLAFTPSMSNQDRNTNSNKAGNGTINIIIFVISGILICLIGICCIGVIFSDPGKIESTPTAEKILSIEEMIAGTYSVAQTQTMIFAPPSSTPFVYDTPTILPPVTFAPTWTPIPTQTPFVLATQGIIPAGSNCNPSYPDVCIHDNPRLNCDELGRLGIYQFRVLPPDPLGYDKDQDGIGCENKQ